MHQRVFQILLLMCVLSPPLWSVLGWNNLAWADKKTDQAEAYLKQAAKYYNDKKFAKAEEAFQQVIAMNVPLSDEFYYHYGRVQVKNNRVEPAIESLQTYIERAGKKGRFYKKAYNLSTKLTKVSEKKQQLLDKNKSNNGKTKYAKSKNSKSVLIIGTPEMVTVKKGQFIMGAKWGDEDQKPPFSKTIIHDFAISKNEITFEEYDRFAKDTGRAMPDDKGWGRGKRPVINVTYHDAVAYTQWLSAKNNRTYRLPTEAEWEYVAKAKPPKKDKTYGHQNLIGRGDANCDGGRYFWESPQTKDVGSYDPNPVGVYDILGNVWEWTCSQYTRRYNGQENSCLPEDKLTGQTIVVRGGSWRSHSRTLRPYIRYNNYPSFKNDDLGFRIVQVDE